MNTKMVTYLLYISILATLSANPPLNFPFSSCILFSVSRNEAIYERSITTVSLSILLYLFLKCLNITL